MPARRRWVAGAVLVGIGWLVTPSAVPVYDGVGVPDEPYRYVSPPKGNPATAEPTTASATTPVAGGVGTNGLIVATKEQSPQFSLFVPPQALATTKGPITVTCTPAAPSDQPSGSTISGNVYVVTVTSPGGAVTTTDKIAIASLYLRAVESSDGWVMQHRVNHTDPWVALQSARGGTDTWVSSFTGPGEYALSRAAAAKGGQTSVLPWLLGGGVALLVLLVVAIRLRSNPE
ncbi:MAG: hypothetical protein JWM40_2786 [Frankiales bacterium]|nr:hypothetical protein [Frankiales bacterium]